jgi:uncharacterized protein
MLPRLSQAQTDALNQFCQRHSVKKLSFFGSVITPRFGRESDIDILIEFQKGKSPGFSFFIMQDELSEILERPVDVTTVGGLHPLLKEKVLQTAETYYDVS